MGLVVVCLVHLEVGQGEGEGRGRIEEAGKIGRSTVS